MEKRTHTLLNSIMSLVLFMAAVVAAGDEKKGITVIYCPADITTVASEGSTAIVTWKEPEFKSTDGYSKIDVFPSQFSGTRFSIGESIVRYIARDDNENSAYCEFKVIVKRWLSCPPLRSPTNGALVCDKQLFKGKEISICLTMCQKGHDVPMKYPIMVMCQNNGKWMSYPSGIGGAQTQMCSAKRSGEEPENMPKLLYYFGLTGSPATETTLKGQFIQYLKTYTPFCLPGVFLERCNSNHVQILPQLTKKDETTFSK